jgi:hypothetical protein
MMQTMETAIEQTEYPTPVDENDSEDAGLGKSEQKDRFIVLRARGYSYARIARELRISKGTLAAWNAELETEIRRVRTMELEALQEEFFLLKEGRIRPIALPGCGNHRSD